MLEQSAATIETQVERIASPGTPAGNRRRVRGFPATEPRRNPDVRLPFIGEFRRVKTSSLRHAARAGELAAGA